ncbi:unnamed protein product [Darwinula stevensoni]|uniref:C2H2-type domain-containing protein n=1 Tax=Darwinula stevensoni TaxID=69355 RepID=A0A7R8XAI5_9CRUS|nr:unnamed protein product [Darwinula stevensoni]CAG0891940.1 unnamed protein product [Darwinula stevensoni]
MDVKGMGRKDWLMQSWRLGKFNARNGPGEQGKKGNSKRIFRYCIHCEFRTMNVYAMYVHTRIHEPPKFPCFLCPMDTNDSQVFQLHMREKHGDGPYSCPKCHHMDADPAKVLQHATKHRQTIKQLRRLHEMRSNLRRLLPEPPQCLVKVEEGQVEIKIDHKDENDHLGEIEKRPLLMETSINRGPSWSNQARPSVIRWYAAPEPFQPSTSILRDQCDSIGNNSEVKNITDRMLPSQDSEPDVILGVPQ